MEAILHDSKTWVAASFVIFMLGFVKYAVPHIIKALDARAQQIKDELEQAVSLREEAQNMLAEYQQKQKAMLAEAEGILKMAQEEAAHMRDAAEEELATEIERRTKISEAKIARAEVDAIRQVQDSMATLATEAAHSLISEHLQDSEDDALIEMALENVERIAH